MAEANINNRASVARLYPRADFEREAGENARAEASVLRGLRIVAPVDAGGQFVAERAARHVGEDDPEGDTLFVTAWPATAAPLAPGDIAYGELEGTRDAGAAQTARTEAYEAFIDRVIAAARAAQFKPAIGLGEERLRGFRGG